MISEKRRKNLVGVPSVSMSPFLKGVRGESASYRYVVFLLVFLLVFLMYTISYADRAALSIAMPALGREFHLSVVELGWLSSSFLWSYFLLNLPSSIVLDAVGPRLMGTLSVAFWSVAMMMGGAVQGVGQFVVTRVFLGVGEAPTFGIGNSILRLWARPRERGSVSTMLLTGQQAGLAAGTLAGAFMIARYGWRAEFVVLGLVGILWAACWWLVYRSPKQDAEGHGHRPARPRMSLAQARRLFRNTSFYAIVIPQCMANYFNFLVISWLPVYFIHRFHQSTLNSGASSAICYVSAALGAVVLGHVLERVVAPGEDRPTWRRFIVFPCMTLGATVGLLPFCRLSRRDRNGMAGGWAVTRGIRLLWSLDNPMTRRVSGSGGAAACAFRSLARAEGVRHRGVIFRLVWKTIRAIEHTHRAQASPTIRPPGGGVACRSMPCPFSLLP